MKKIDEKSVLPKISKLQKDFNKCMSSHKTINEVSAILTELIQNIKIYVVLQDCLQEKLPRSAKKIFTVFFTSLENAAIEFNSQFIDNNFICEYNQICSIITTFVQDYDLIELIWNITEKIISQNATKISYSKWEDSIQSLFNMSEIYSDNFLNYLIDKIPTMSYGIATLWWNMFSHIILPQFLNFNMTRPPAKQSNEKKLNRIVLKPIVSFVFEFMNFRPSIHMFTLDDIDSCFALLSILRQIIFEGIDSQRMQIFIHQCSENMLNISVTPGVSDSEKSPFAFLKCKINVPEDEQSKHAEIFNKIRESTPEMINSIFVLLLKDIELYYMEQTTSKLCTSVFRLNYFISILSSNKMTPAEAFTISGAFFLVIARFNTLQLYRLFIEYTLRAKEIAIESWRYMLVPCNNEKLNVKQVACEFISQVTVAGAPVIFGTSLSDMLFPGCSEKDPITVEAYLNQTKPNQVFFSPMKEIDWTYQQYEKYIIDIVSTFSMSGDIPFITSFAATLEKLTSYTPKTDKTNISKICHRILGLLNPTNLSEDGIHTAAILITHASELTDKEKETWSSYFISQLPKEFAFNEIAHISLSPPFLPDAMNMILKAAEAATKFGIKINGIGTINILSASLCFTNDESITTPIFALVQHCFTKEKIKTFFTFAIRTLLEKDNDYCQAIFTEGLSEIRKGDEFQILQIIAINRPELFDSDETRQKVFQAAERVINDPNSFKKALIVIQDLFISSRKMSQFWNFIASFRTDDNDEIKQHIESSKHAIFEASIGMKWGNNYEEEMTHITKSKENTLIIEQQHMLGSTMVELYQVMPKTKQIDVDIEIEEEEEPEEFKNSNEEEMKSVFQTALLKLKDFKQTKASDFKFEYTKEQDKRQEEKEQNDEKLKEEPTKNDTFEANAFVACSKMLQDEKQNKKIMFETFDVNIVLLNESEKFNDFSNFLGTKMDDGTIHYVTYRTKVIFHIKTSLEECNSKDSFVWEDKGYDATFGKGMLISLRADLYPLIVVSSSELRGFFEGTTLIKAPILAKLMQWNPTLTR